MHDAREDGSHIVDQSRLGMQDSIVSSGGCEHGVCDSVEEAGLKQTGRDLCCLTRRSFDLHCAYPVMPDSCA